MLALILGVALVGFVVYLITEYIPMPQPFKLIVYAIAAIALILFIMRSFGIQDLPLR